MPDISSSTCIGFISLTATGNDPFADLVLETAAVRLTIDRDLIPVDIVSDRWITPLSIHTPDDWKNTLQHARLMPNVESVDVAIGNAIQLVGDVSRIIAVDLRPDVISIVKRYFGRTATSGWLTFDAVARIAFPTASGHDVSLIAEHLGGRVAESAATTGARFANDRATLAAEIWPEMFAELIATPSAVLSEMAWITGILKTPIRNLIRDLAADAASKDYRAVFEGEAKELKDLLADFSAINLKKRNRSPDDEDEDEEPDAPSDKESLPPPVSEDAVRDFFSSDGVLGKTLSDYEYRPQQLEMAVTVARALNEKKHLVVEAGTGVGKSLAYLVPAIMFAVTTHKPIVVSTNTKNLQSQLIHQDIPFLKAHFPSAFSAAILKGRSNYLCLRKLFALIQSAQRELEPGEILQMPAVLKWAFGTVTGDKSELTGADFGKASQLWDKLHTIGEDCLGRACGFYRHCFVYKARGEALDADVTVTNHALVFSDLGMDKILPKHKHVIFDEAHNIEDVATEHLSVHIFKWRFYAIMNRLFRPSRKKKRSAAGGGLIPAFITALKKIPSGKITNRDDLASLTTLMQERAILAMTAVEALNDALADFFESLGVLFSGRNAREEKVRFRAAEKPPELWNGIDEKKSRLIAACGQLLKPIEQILEDYKPLLKSRSGDFREIKTDLDAQATWLTELIVDLEFALKGEEDNYVYWVEAVDTVHNDYRISAAPLEVAPILAEQLYAQRDSVVMTSATMTCGLTFRFIKNRLGVELLDEDEVFDANVGTPFDFQRQVELLVPTFLPEPSQRDFDARLAATATGAIIAAGGRSLCLYTSHYAVRTAYELMADTLQRHGIAVYAQTISGPRDMLLERFKRDEQSVLLGTSSFWEGVDVPGPSLSLLIIAKLPFAVFTDPILKARADHLREQGKDPFNHLSVPSAVLRWRQGFGRLIRHKNDSGVVIACDKRLLTRRYGAGFLRALPVKHDVVRNDEELVKRVSDSVKIHRRRGAAPGDDGHAKTRRQ